MQRSESIAKLAEALAKAQGQMTGAKKDSANPFFKSKYADLASVIDAIKQPLADNGLAYCQFPRSTETGVEVETILMHSSGEWMSDVFAIPVAKADAQGFGSATTYARRYPLQSIMGVAAEDDDGNAAAASVGGLREQGLTILKNAARGGFADMETAWKMMSKPMQLACKGAEMEQIKKDAQAVDANHKEVAHASAN